VLSVSGAPLVTTGAISTKVSTTTTSAKASAAVGSVNLLNGLITATAVQAVSTTSQDQNGLHVSGASSIFDHLVVAGVQQSSNVAANTTIALAGLGTVVLNQQIVTGGTATARLTVNMIHVYITVANNLLGIAVGTQLIVASADSSLQVVDGPGVLYGFSYGTRVSGKLVQSSSTAIIYLPCLGTDGQTRTNTLASVNVPGVLTSGTVTDTATGNITPSLISGRTTATVQALNLLNGL